MHPFKKKSQMTAAEFNVALREAGFGVAPRENCGRVWSVCRFTAVPIFRGNGSVDRNATLSKVLWEREAEIKRRAGST